MGIRDYTFRTRYLFFFNSPNWKRNIQMINIMVIMFFSMAVTCMITLRHICIFMSSYSLTSPSGSGWWTLIIGIIIFVLAFGLEAISDAQKYRFKQGPGKKPGAVCDVGFFKLSRHPNYFAEIMTQVCMYTL